MTRRALAAAVAAWVAVVALTSGVAWVAIDRAGREVLTAPASGLVGAGGPLTSRPLGTVPATVPTKAPAPGRTSPDDSTAPRAEGSGSPSGDGSSPSPDGSRSSAPGHASSGTWSSSGGSDDSHSGSADSHSGSSGSSPRPSEPGSSTTSAAVDRSVRVEGGQVGVRCVGQTASLRFAQPSNGWHVAVDKSGPEQVRVTFTETSGDRHRSEVEAECENGTPAFSTSSDGDRSGQPSD